MKEVDCDTQTNFCVTQTYNLKGMKKYDCDTQTNILKGMKEI